MLNKRKMLGVAVLGFSTLMAASSYAALPGAYVGGQLGWGKVHQASSTIAHATSSNTGLAGRIFAGYEIDPIWAAELGWTKFSTVDLKQTGLGYNVRGHLKTDAVDLVGKASFPVANKVSIYGKAGAAYVYERGSANATLTRGSSVVKFHDSDKAHKVYPTLGAGVSYEFSPSVSSDVSYNRIQKIGSSSKIGSTDLVSMGLTYHIG